MYRPTSWRATVSNLPSITSIAPRRTGRRFASSFAARTSARATGTLVRWGLAAAAVYYYNTSTVFADEPRYATQSHLENSDETYSSIESITEQRRAQAKTSSNTTATTTAGGDQTAPSPLESPEDLEQEAQQQGAFNEETGEINWDCPCLGGMADGPCGEQFKSAFSCFVFSKEEPKGVDCIENFKTMQTCFREHPDIYGAELDDEDGADVDSDSPQPGIQHAVETARENINDTVERTADAISADVGQATEAVQQLAHTSPVPATQESNQQRVLSTRGKDTEAWHDSTGDNGSISKTQK